jgi:hypothetical protein
MIWTDENHSDRDHLITDIDITVTATATPATRAGDQMQSIKLPAAPAAIALEGEELEVSEPPLYHQSPKIMRLVSHET